MLPREYTGDFGLPTHRAAADVTEVAAYCADCQEEREFRLAEVDVARYDAADLDPVLQDAVNGEPIWRCPHCGRLEPDLVNRHAYDLGWRDPGFTVWPPAADAAAGGDEIPRGEAWPQDGPLVEAREPRGRGVNLEHLVARETLPDEAGGPLRTERSRETLDET